MSKRTRVLLAAALASALLALCFRGVEPGRLLALVRGADGAWLLTALCVNGVIPLLWTAQWRLFLPRDRALGFRAMFGVVATMAMLVNSVPLLVGTATGVHLLARRARVGNATALSVIALDQLAEGMAKLLVLLALAWFTPLPSALRSAAAALAVGVALLLLAVTAAARAHGRERSYVPSLHALAAARRFIGDWAAGLEGARRPGVLAGGLTLGLAMKCAEAGGILAVQAALGVDLPVWSALAVLAAVNLSTMVSVAPGNVGVYEGSTYLAYTALGLAPESALGLALLQHAAYLAPMAGTGWVMMILAPGQGAAQAAAEALDERPEGARSDPASGATRDVA
jgi:uncharacterized membrane protein YbhN (UPF0104 family)